MLWHYIHRIRKCLLFSSILEMCFSKKELCGYWSGVSSLTWLHSAPFQPGSQDKAAAAESDTPARTVGLKYKRHTGTVAIFSLSLSRCLYLFTSTLAKLPVASPEDSYEGGSVMRSSPDVVILPEEDVVTVLHAAETTQVHTCPNIKNNDESSNKHALHTDGRLLTIQQNSESPQTERIPLCVPTAESLRHSGKITHCCPL